MPDTNKGENNKHVSFLEKQYKQKIIQATKKIQATNVSYKNNTGWSERD